MATRKFDKNQFVCEYSGELISHKEGLTREQQYKSDVGCFLFFFRFKGERWWYV